MSEDVNITTSLVHFLIKEHKFKKDVLYKNMLHISNLIIDESTAQSLTPTINSILSTSLDNDKIILKLIEVLKRHGSKEIDNDIEEEIEDSGDNTSELIKLIQSESEESIELSDHLDKKVEESEEYNKTVSEEQKRIDKLDELDKKKNG